MAKKHKTPDSRDISRNLLLAGYGATVLIFFAASFFPDVRLWGFSTWGYLPLWDRLVMAALALGIIPLIARSTESGEATLQALPARWWLSSALVILALFGVSFWFLRGQTHFLGDGYTNLSTMAAEHPIIKGREIGEIYLHLWLAGLLGGNSAANVLLSYQLIALVSGLCLIGAVAFTAARLFGQVIDRMLFTLGVATAGQMLLFYGYVENYSLFALSVGVFTCIGILIARQMLSRWVVLLPLALAIFFHVFGVTLIPSALYLLITGTPAEKKIERFSLGTRLAFVAGLGLVGLVVLLVAMSRSLFLKIALLTFTSGQFTIDGYTLFSPAHLLDMLNLIFLLLPGVGILILAMSKGVFRGGLKFPEYRYLAILLLSVLGAAFIFDPKLGMPRDWDLYSFPAIPLAVIAVLPFLDGRFKIRWGRAATVCVIAVGALSLSARCLTQVMPSAALRQIHNYIALDHTKSKNALVYLQTYYQQTGDSAALSEVNRQYAAFPDEQLQAQMVPLVATGKNPPALLAMAREAARANPMSSRAYAYMGSAYLRMGQVDSAVVALETSLALNPHNADALTGLAFIRLNLGNDQEAEKMYRQATLYSPEKSTPWFYLAQLYQRRQEIARQIECLETAATKSDAFPEIFVNLGDAFAARGQFDKAASAYRNGLSHGLDSSFVQNRITKYPPLRQFFAPDAVTK